MNLFWENPSELTFLGNKQQTAGRKKIAELFELFLRTSNQNTWNKSGTIELKSFSWLLCYYLQGENGHWQNHNPEQSIFHLFPVLKITIKKPPAFLHFSASVTSKCYLRSLTGTGCHWRTHSHCSSSRMHFSVCRGDICVNITMQHHVREACGTSAQAAEGARCTAMLLRGTSDPRSSLAV